MAKDKIITLDYSIGEHPIKKDTVVITVSGTGINVLNKDHHHFMEVMLNVISSQMYAKANGMEIEDCKYLKTQTMKTLKEEQQEWFAENAPYGKELGYPDCCIKEFCNQPPALLNKMKYPSKDDVLITNRNIMFSPFPQV